MKPTFILAMLTVCLLAAAPAKAQMLTNAGGIIFAQPSSVVWVNGNALMTGGETTFSDLAELRINGMLSIDAGKMTFNLASFGVVTSDCFIGTAGELHRLGTGTLFLNGITTNNGLIVNDGVIEYGVP